MGAWFTKQADGRHLHVATVSCRRFVVVMAAFGSTLVLCSADVSCGGLATENRGKDSGVMDSLSGDVEAEAQVEAAANPCIISASSYDASCSDDSDCAAVWFGDACSTSCPGCEPNGAINVSASSAYSQDISNLSRVVDARFGACPCPPPQGAACCSRGTCVFESQCHG